VTTILDAPSLASAVAVLAHPLRRGGLGADQAFVRSLTRVPENLWDTATKRSAWELLARHRSEIERLGVDFAALPVPSPMATKPRPNGRSVNIEGGAWVFRFRYDAGVIAALKAAISGRRWNPDLKIWTAPLSSSPEVHTFAAAHGFDVLSKPAEVPELVPEVLRAPTKPRKTRPKVEPIRTKRIATRGDRWVIYPAPRSPAAVVAEIKAMPHALYRPGEQCWTVPVAQCSEQVLAFADRWGYEVDAAAGSTAAAVVERTGRLLALSEAHKADDPLCAPFPIEGMTTLLTPDPWQWAGIRYMMEAKRTFNADCMGLGKLQPVSEPVLTSAGWTTMGALSVGDLVIGRNGQPTEVTGVFPQTDRRVYEVVFSDGASTRCGPEHLWAVRDARGAQRGVAFRAVTTQQIVDGAKIRNGGYSWSCAIKAPNGNRRLQIPMVDPVYFETQILPLEPYKFGVILGNGSITRSGTMITGDEWIPREHGWEGTNRDHPSEGISDFRLHEPATEAALNDMGLRGHRAWEKFVPVVYLLGHPDDRLALLQGLMDTDGTPIQGGGAEFISTARPLVDAVVELVRSLGGIAKPPFPAAATFTYKGEKRQGRPAWRVNVKLPAPYNLFRLPRKADAYVVPTKYPPTRIIESIRPVGSEATVCIRVAAPDHLYVTKDYIVTHNTMQAILAATAAKAFPAVCVVPSSVKINWKREWEMWVPGIHVEVLYGTKGRSLAALVPPDVYVLNYDVLGRYDRATGSATGWLPHLAAINPKTLILDESHYIAHASTQRTAACEGLAASLDPDANIYLLTGTAVMSKAKEAASQLKIMRRMAELGGTRYFNARYVKTVAFLPELNHRLRARAFVRRTDELLGIRKARPSYVPLELDPVVMAEYAKASDDVVEYLRAWALNAALEAGATDEEARSAAWHKAMKASMAEHLVRIGVLKRLAGRAKLPAAIAHIEEVLTDPDEKVIVFAENTELVDAIAARFGGTKIQGGQNAGERQSAVDRFNDDLRCRVIAAQLQAGNAGINLQRSCRHVMFLQQGWTPAIHLQAEGRAFRRGQTRTVIPTYLVAPDTVDQAITKLVADKRPIVDAVMDGKTITDEQAAALDRSIAEDLLVGMVDDALDG